MLLLTHSRLLSDGLCEVCLLPNCQVHPVSDHSPNVQADSLATPFNPKILKIVAGETSSSLPILNDCSMIDLSLFHHERLFGFHGISFLDKVSRPTKRLATAHLSIIFDQKQIDRPLDLPFLSGDCPGWAWFSRKWAWTPKFSCTLCTHFLF